MVAAAAVFFAVVRCSVDPGLLLGYSFSRGSVAFVFGGWREGGAAEHHHYETECSRLFDIHNDFIVTDANRLAIRGRHANRSLKPLPAHMSWHRLAGAVDSLHNNV